MTPDEYRSSTRDSERLPVTVLLTYGDWAEMETDPGNGHVERVRSARLAEETGIPVDQLPGQRLVAVVEGGELVRFERP